MRVALWIEEPLDRRSSARKAEEGRAREAWVPGPGTLHFACWLLAGLHGSLCCNVVGSLTSSLRVCNACVQPLRSAWRSAWRDDIDPCSMFHVPPVGCERGNTQLFCCAVDRNATSGETLCSTSLCCPGEGCAAQLRQPATGPRPRNAGAGRCRLFAPAVYPWFLFRYCMQMRHLSVFGVNFQTIHASYPQARASQVSTAPNWKPPPDLWGPNFSSTNFPIEPTKWRLMNRRSGDSDRTSWVPRRARHPRVPQGFVKFHVGKAPILHQPTEIHRSPRHPVRPLSKPFNRTHPPACAEAAVFCSLHGRGIRSRLLNQSPLAQSQTLGCRGRST